MNFNEKIAETEQEMQKLILEKQRLEQALQNNYQALLLLQGRLSALKEVQDIYNSSDGDTPINTE